MDVTDKTTTVHTKARWAQIVSDIFSPIQMPTYGRALAMWIRSLRNIPESNRLIATLWIGFITGVIPFIMLATLIRLGKIKDNAISRRSERILPMSIASGCYVAAAIFISALGAPIWLQMFFIGASAATSIALIITLWWKISAHTTAAGGVLGMTAWCVANGLADVNSMLILSIVIIITGLIATSRLILSRHTLSQTIAGIILGFISCYGFMHIH